MTLENLIIEKFKIKKEGSPPYKAQEGTRETLAQFFGETGFKNGAEIGVLRGAYSLLLCQYIPNLKLKCIDPWAAFRRNSQERMDRNFRRARLRLKRFDAELIKKTSMDAVREITNGCLDFVYIDGMHEFDFVMPDIIFWSDKVKSGGIVAGHDYIPDEWHTQVKSAVDIYAKIHGIKDYYLTSEIQTDHTAPSFFWVKP